ncbi:MAG TPA: VOC family protein [Verrucomicrobiaceae bacterium]
MSTKKAAKKKSTKKPAKKVVKKAARKAKPSSKLKKQPKDQGGGMCSKPGDVHWNELQTSDAAGAKAFYTGLFGWTTEPFPGGGMDYTILCNNGKGFGGIMQSPHPGAPTQWVGYIVVEDVDATVAKVERLGGKVCAPPFDIPQVGRIAIVQDPQGAVFGVHKPQM